MIVYPVIHYKDEETSWKNLEIIFEQELQADGVFLISMEGNDNAIIPLAIKFKKKYPYKKIGVNLLRTDSFTACYKTFQNGLDMLWDDKPIICNMKWNLDKNVYEYLKHYKEKDYFSSFAFKYQQKDYFPGYSLKTIEKLGYYPVTSGSGTGISADLEELENLYYMSSKSGNNVQLGIASGLTAENIKEYKPYITCAIVATGISENFYEFDQEKFNNFMRNSK